MMNTFTEARAILAEYWPRNQARHEHSLEKMRHLMAYLGDPQERVQVIHVAGTSGKTSTAYYAAALLCAAGKKVGLTISPHVDEINERVQVNMEPLPEATFCKELGEFLKVLEGSGITPTYFELMVAFAFWHFERIGVDYAVVEVGIGGLLDSTNVVRRQDKVCVITDIGYDHTKVLGNTLPEIAAQKAGIIQEKNRVFCHPQDAVIMEPIEQVARQKHAALYVVGDADERTDFLPLFQRRNFGLAAATVGVMLDRPLVEKELLSAAHILVPARMEIREYRGKLLILDAAHNPQKLHALMQSVQDKFPGQPVATMVSFLKGQLDSKTEEIALAGNHLIITSFERRPEDPYHSVAPEQVAAVLDKQGYTDYESILNVADALKSLLERPEPVLLVTGSFYLLNHVRPLLTSNA